MSDKIMHNQLKELSDSASSESEPDLTCLQKLEIQKNEASLFIFNRKNKIRQFCLNLTETPETIQEYLKLLKEGKLEEYDHNQQ